MTDWKVDWLERSGKREVVAVNGPMAIHIGDISSASSLFYALSEFMANSENWKDWAASNIGIDPRAHTIITSSTGDKYHYEAPHAD